ncbi:ParA family protein [Nocardia sp. alder85J]|uniref:ParA family protein n=1 Tax=Nocardia sp. alder85J TaxID=2862949 RepID=UPI001CD6A62D|nr:ParA family protein [Nocardia sp. alder85J]MCX4099106.1 ParA family protein [Nocardia sp. alder85J]
MVATAVMNLKGGPGKSVVVNGLAHAAAARAEAARAAAEAEAAATRAAAEAAQAAAGDLAADDEAVLIGDMDPQGNTTRHLTGYSIENVPPNGTLADVLDRQVDKQLADVVLPARTREGIYVAPSGFEQMQAVQDSLLGKPGGELSVRMAFREAKTQGRVLFDTRPAVDLVTRAAMLAADNLIIVTTPEFDSIDGMLAVFKALSDLETYMEYRLPLVGVVINQLDGRRNDHTKGIEWIRNYCANNGIEVLGEPFPMAADISRLTNAGLGMDQHPQPTARSRSFATNFAAILDAIDKEAASR